MPVLYQVAKRLFGARRTFGLVSLIHSRIEAGFEKTFVSFFLVNFFLTLRLCEPTCRWPGVSRVKALLAGEAELSNMVLKFVETSFETLARLPPLVRTEPAMLFPDPGLVGLELEQDSVTAPVPLLPPTTPPEPLLNKMSTSKSTRSWSLI